MWRRLLWGLVVLATGCSTAGPPVPTPTSGTLPPTIPLVSPRPTSPPVSPSTPTATEATPLPAPMGTAHDYTVQPGDTLLALAIRFDVPIAALQLANDLGESTTINAGERLVIPPSEPWAEASPFWSIHLVRPGETLSGIAADYGVPLHRLLAINHLSGVEPIHVGDPIILPLEGPTVTTLPAPSPLPTIAPSPTPTPQLPTRQPTALPPAAEPSGWAEQLHHLINATRAGHNLPPLTWNGALASAAQAHAEDCAARGWGSHVGSDGADLLTRLRRAGYQGDGWAECWAQSLSPEAALQAWMDETPPDDPHRRTILSTWLTEIGIGVAQADWGYFFIADFGR